MPNTSLLRPVLEGLSKFAHMINVEFFEDLVSSLSDIVDQKVYFTDFKKILAFKIGRFFTLY